MPKLGIAFFGMAVGGAAFLIAGMTVYLTMAQLQYRTLARLQDRPVQAVQAINPDVVRPPAFAVVYRSADAQFSRTL